MGKHLLTTTGVEQTSLVDQLPTPFYIAHRGNPHYAPEHTMSAYRQAVTMGSDAIEFDVFALKDGGLVNIHDTTLDRTTDATGNVANMDTQGFRRLNAADLTPWPNEAPAFYDQALAEFAHNTVIFVEPKASTYVDAMITTANRYPSAKKTCVFQVSSTTDLAKVINAGYKALYIWFGTPTSPQIAAAVSGGASFLCCGYTQSDATVGLLVATGLPTVIYTINRRYDRDRFLALGVKGFFSDCAPYLKANTAVDTRDPWNNYSFGHGLIPQWGSEFRTMLNTEDIGFNAGNGIWVGRSGQGTLYASVGHVSPIANRAGTFQLDIDYVIPATGISAGSAVAVGIATDDRPAGYNGNWYPDGYHFYLRESGVMSIFRTNAPSGFTQLGANLSTDQLVAGTVAKMRINVTPTTVSLTRMDGTLNVGVAMSRTDNTFRGGYVHVGRTGPSGIKLVIRSLVIT